MKEIIFESQICTCHKPGKETGYHILSIFKPYQITVIGDKLDKDFMIKELLKTIEGDLRNEKISDFE